MSKTRWKTILFSLGIILFFTLNKFSQAESNSDIRYIPLVRSQHTIHTVIVPHQGYSVIPVVEAELTHLTDFATKHKAIAAINGGYFDPKNQKTTSYIIQQATIVADPRTNERLIDNPDLQAYLGKILNRTEFRRYLCGNTPKYDIVLRSAPIPANCQLQDALGGGPALLPKNTAVAEGFVAYEDGKLIRDAIATNSPNARSAVGITQDGDIVLAMVAQRSDLPTNSGISLPDLADFLSSIGVTKAMNLDGGSSSALFYQDNVVYGRVDKEGNKIERPIKSVLLVKETEK
ncbi:MAG: phosphodiester glycosidase family protein [Pleurocapsa sp.]